MQNLIQNSLCLLEKLHTIISKKIVMSIEGKWFTREKKSGLHTTFFYRFDILGVIELCHRHLRWILPKCQVLLFIKAPENIEKFSLCSIFQKHWLRMLLKKLFWNCQKISDRSCRSQTFFKIGALKNFADFSGKQLCWSFF